MIFFAAHDIVSLVQETLRLVDRFLPRIVFGKAAASPGQPNPSSANIPDTTGFAYLKRDLVRLLGTICHEHKEIQDRIRECGGIAVVMNLCVIDERNPCRQLYRFMQWEILLIRCEQICKNMPCLRYAIFSTTIQIIKGLLMQ